jgi:hypothetical protein
VATVHEASMLNHRSHEVERVGGEGGGEGGGKEGDGEDESGERVVVSTHCGRRFMKVRCGLSEWSLERCSSLTEVQTWVERIRAPTSACEPGKTFLLHFYPNRGAR